MRLVDRDRDRLIVGGVVVERIHDHLLLHAHAEPGEQGGEPRLQNVAEVVHEQCRSALREVGGQDLALGRQIGGAWVHRDDPGAVGRDGAQGRRDYLAGLVAERFQGAPEAAGAVGFHLDEGRALVTVAVGLHRLHMGVELEVVEGVLAVPFHEADGRDTLAQEPLDAERNVVLVGAHDLDPPAVGLQDRGVVDADPVGLGELRLLVGIDGADVQQRGVAAEHLDQVPGAAPGLVLRLIEVREPDLVREGSDDRFGLWRRGEAALPGQVEVRVVAGQREVRQKRDAERHQHRTPGEGERPEARRAALERQPGPEPEEDQQRGQPPGEPERVDKIATHRDLPPGERPHAQKEARESDAQEEAHVRQEERAGGERREVAEQRGGGSRACRSSRAKGRGRARRRRRRSGSR